MAQLEAAAPMPVVQKESNKLISARGGQKTFPFWLNGIIMEQLVNNTPPSSINSNILSVMKVVCPSTKIIELPSLDYNRRLRTVLATVSLLLAAYRLAGSKYWKQLHTDGTSRRQSSKVNLVVNVQEEDGSLVPIVLTTNILPVNDASAVVCESICDAIDNQGKLLTKWSVQHEAMFDTDHTIPKEEEMSLSKASNYATVNTDTCNQAQKLNVLLVEAIENCCRERNIPEDEIKVFTVHCHNHLRNVWIGAMDTELSKYLNNILREDLAKISKESNGQLRVTTHFAMVLRAIDKEFSLCCNYPKGDGDKFRAWREEYHPGSLVLPIERACGGSRQDLTVEGAGAVYMNRRYYLEFLNECLVADGNNILQKNLWIVLSCKEMIAMTRVYAIFYVGICLPMRFLAGRAHQLAAHDFSCRSPNQAIDMLDAKLKAIVDDEQKFLNKSFMMSIFQEMRDKITPFDEYLTYQFEEKLNPTMDKSGSLNEEFRSTKKVGLKLLVEELFSPKQLENIETHELVMEMGKIAAQTFMREFRNTKKATSKNFSGTNGP